MKKIAIGFCMMMLAILISLMGTIFDWPILIAIFAMLLAIIGCIMVIYGAIEEG